jgi:polyribonucleotide nucleotidyltransferase
MIDPVSIGLAVAGAKTAVNMIREAINVGHDIASMTKELGSFFTAQGEVEAAAKEAEAIRKDPKRNKEKSATAIAMDCVLRAEELRAAEQELRNMFSLQGKLDMYKRMCDIRANIIESRQQEIRDQNRVEQQKLKKKKQSETELKTAFYLFLPPYCCIYCLSAAST